MRHGILAVQEPVLILTLKGQKRVSSVTGLERSKNCSFCTVKAPGIFVPLIFIYSQQRMASLVEKAVPPDAIYSCYKSGWTIEELFIVWLCHFMCSLKHQPENPFLLIPDIHNNTDVCRSNLADKMALLLLLSCPILYTEFHSSISRSLEQ